MTEFRSRHCISMCLIVLGLSQEARAQTIAVWNLEQLYSAVAATGPNAAVRMGLGYNSLEWLTVRDARFAQANIDTGLQPLDPWDAAVRIVHVASTGSARGLSILNFGPQTSGQTLETEIGDSQGSLIVNNNAVDSTVNVTSSGNQFHDNGGGTIIVGGLSSNNTRADGNAINLEARGDRFVGNRGTSAVVRGGLIVFGGENSSGVTGGGSHDTVHVRLWGCRMSDNAEADLIGIGAQWLSGSTAGLSVNNQVMIEIHGDGNESGRWQRVEFAAATEPAGPTYGNTATVNASLPVFGSGGRQ